MQGRQFCPENAQALSRNAIRLAALLGWKRLDPALLLQAANGPIKCSRAETAPAKTRNVFDHGVSMLWAAGKAGQHKQRRVGIVPQLCVFIGFCYASHTTHYVVIAQPGICCKKNY